MMPQVPVTPRPASTVVLMRDSEEGPEVLLLRRPPSGFAAGAWVFPGGTVDSGDYRLMPATAEEPARWAERLEVSDPLHAWGHVAAAIRETWEETGLLLGHCEQPEDELRTTRERVLNGIDSFPDVTRKWGFAPRTEGLVYLSRWITPHSYPRRYDTRFFLSTVPAESSVTLSGEELLEAVWIDPELAIARHGEGEYHLMVPTLHTLRHLTGGGTVDQVMKRLAQMPPPSYLPRMRTDAEGVIIDIRPPDLD